MAVKEGKKKPQTPRKYLGADELTVYITEPSGLLEAVR